MEELMLSEGYHSIKYLYSPSEGKHYRIKYECLHSDENKLSTLRVKLLEQLQADSEHPLLVCSCCNRPVLLSGNSGLKGEIIGFRHFGEGNIYTGEHVGENITVPKQEDEAELNYMAVLFSEYAPLLEEYERHQSFLLMPGMERDRPGDITFEYEGKKVAVIFASAGHPLDFIIRRSKTAVDAGYIPIWILSPSYLTSSVISSRDISVFTQGYICTINDVTVKEFNITGEPCLLAKDYYNGENKFITLKQFINDSEANVNSLLSSQDGKSPSAPKQKRKRINKTATHKDLPTATEVKPAEQCDISRKQRFEHSKSVMDYWDGHRIKINDDLYLEKIGESWGILNLATLRYPVLPVYDDIRISDDNSEVILIMNGKEPVVKKIESL